MRKVNRPAKVGEYIQIVNIDNSEERYQNGYILKVKSAYATCNYGDVYVEGTDPDDEWLVLYNEYVVLEDYNPCELQQKVYSGYEDNNLIFKYENEKEGMINMNQVLKLYLDRHSDEITKKYNNLIEKDYEELEIVKEYKTLINEFEINLQLLFDREENQINNVFERVVTHNVYKYDLDENRLKNEIAMKYAESKKQELEELDDLIEEVNAQLSLSDDFEYQLDVLKRYDIINKKTNRVN